MKYVLGIDFGGGSSKATLLAENGKVIAENSVEYPTAYPKPGWAEQNPEDWYLATEKNIKDLLGKSGIDASDIVAISLDAATHTAVLMDEDFNVLCPSIYWTDTRSKNEVEYLRENFGDMIYDKVFHAPGTIWTLPELLWVKNNLPEIWQKTKRITFAKDYVRHQLTGDFVTDFIEAEGSMMFDFNTLSWSEELLDILELSPENLPRIVNPKDIVGKISKDVAKKTGLFEGTKVLCGTTDTVMEVFAAGATKKGQMTLKLATAGRICVISDKAYPHKNLINYSHIKDGLWYPGTATKSCAASYRWFRDTFNGDYAELDRLASETSVGADGMVFHPYLNGELTPYQDPTLSASFTGVKASHTLGHFARAVMEGVAMSMLDCMKTLEEIGIPHEETAVIIGGGGKSKFWRQIVSDALGITFIGKEHNDSSFGSAMLAGIAAGLWKDEEEALDACNKTLFTTEPNPENTEKYQRLFAKYKDIQKALEDIYHKDYEI